MLGSWNNIGSNKKIATSWYIIKDSFNNHNHSGPTLIHNINLTPLVSVKYENIQEF